MEVKIFTAQTLGQFSRVVQGVLAADHAAAMDEKQAEIERLTDERDELQKRLEDSARQHLEYDQTQKRWTAEDRATIKRLREALEAVKKIPIQYVNEGDDPYDKEYVADTCGELEERIRVIAEAALADPAPETKCLKPVGSGGWGGLMQFLCLLDAGHDGPCTRHSCVKHGPYWPKDSTEMCPQWPACVEPEKSTEGEQS